MDFLDQLKKKLNESFYLGIKQFETHLAVYPPDAFYQKHKDRFEQDSSRVFTFILYLNLDWKKEWGGELLLYNEDHQLLEEIIPKPGTLVCFLPEMFPHEVLPSKRERRSFTGWMHNKLIY
jgi:SM-20-related protein